MFKLASTPRAAAPRHDHVSRVLATIAVAGLAVPAQADSSTAVQQVPTEEIVVTGRLLFPDVPLERDLTAEDITGYGLSTVDELLAEVQAELGDDTPPLILINGERQDDLSAIAGFPVEALQNVQVYPRNSATRLGGSPRQRVINIGIRPTFRAVTLTGARRIATDGDWHGSRGEGILSYVEGATRANLAIRARGESDLLESDRDILQPVPSRPYALGGNVLAYPNLSGEIDPLLSAEGGRVVSIAAVPVTASPTLANFAANADNPATDDLGEFRTLRPRSSDFEINGTFSTRVARWLTATSAFRLNRGNSRSLRGLPSGIFLLDDANPASPFSRDVALLYYRNRPFRTRFARRGGDASLTLNGRFGRWTSNLIGRHSQSRDEFSTERQTSFGTIVIDNSVNPFATNVSELIGLRSDRALTRSINDLAQITVAGPAAKLPAGDLRATVEGRLDSNRVRSESSFSPTNPNTRFHRSAQMARLAVDVPLASRANGFLAAIGELGASAEISRVHFSDAGTLNNHSAALTWEPLLSLHLSAGIEHSERPASVQLLGNAVIETAGVRMFDPLTGNTVDVVQITGGNRLLRPETTNVRQVSGSVRVLPRLNLSLNSEYTDSNVRNFVSSLPDASAAVMLAFPDRFVRDSGGALTTIDLRPVNFGSHREKRIRNGLSLNTSLSGGPSAIRGTTADGDEEAAERPPTQAQAQPPGVRTATRLQITANHTIVFSDRILIRPGLDSVDLLNGGAVGIATGRTRHQFDATAGILSGGLGARLSLGWRGRSTLQTRVGSATDTLEFSPLLLVNFRAFTDARRLFGRHVWTRGMRLSFNVMNATNDRQRVRDSSGHTPLQYQPGYRDPIGRTIEFELRKVF